MTDPLVIALLIAIAFLAVMALLLWSAKVPQAEPEQLAPENQLDIRFSTRVQRGQSVFII